MKFIKNRGKKKAHISIMIISSILVLLTGTVILYKSFAIYERKQSFAIVSQEIPDQKYDTMLAFYVNNEFVETIPEKNENYTVTVSCNNGATGEWDYENWNIKNLKVTESRTKCKLYFKEAYTFSTVAQAGDYVSYTPSSTSYTTDTSMTGYSETETINPSELNLWRVLQITDEGVELISEYVSSDTITFYGQTGYQNLVGYLNILASQYETEGITVGSRYTGYNGQTEFITDTSALTASSIPWYAYTDDGTMTAEDEAKGGGDILYKKDVDLVESALGTLKAYNSSAATETSEYWISSRYYSYDELTGNFYFAGRTIWSNRLSSASLLDYLKGDYNPRVQYPCSYSLRPIVTSNSSLSVTGSGTSDDPWILN